MAQKRAIRPKSVNSILLGRKDIMREGPFPRSFRRDFHDKMVKIFNEIEIKVRENKRSSDKHRRYFLMVKFLYRTDARIDEILILKPLDINLATNTIRLKTLKQGKDKNRIQREKFRIISIHPDLRDTYMQYLLEFNIPQKGDDLLFPMKRQVVDLYFKKIQEKIGIRIQAHKFRHTFAVKAIMDNVPLNVLQQWSWHSSISRRASIPR